MKVNSKSTVSEDFANSIVQDQELKSTLSKKRKTHIEKSIPQELKEKYISEGWEFIKDNQSTSRIKKAKVHNVLFEDKIWVVLAKMGFKQMNADANLKLPYSKDETIPGRQTDVFAVDNETILVVECKSSEEMQKKSLQTIINDFATVKRGAIPFLKGFL